MRLTEWRRRMGIVAASAAALFLGWLGLALVAAVPAPEVRLLEQSGIRLLAELTVLSLLVAAVGFWDE